MEGKKTLVEYLLKNKPLPWSKITSIKSLTASAKRLKEIASRYAIGLTARDLPICVVPGDRRAAFSEELKGLYERLPESFTDMARASTTTDDLLGNGLQTAGG